MYGHCLKREYEKFKNLAIILGAEPEEEIESKGTQSTRKNLSPMQFGAPEDYAHLNEDEKQDLSERMMGMHKGWAASKTPSVIRGG